MIYVQFLLGLMFYSAVASLSYLNHFKQSAWYIPLGIALGFVTSAVWLTISKNEPNSSVLLVKGLWWDAMLTLTYVIIPLMFFEARLSSYQWAGLILVFIGLIMTKVG